MYEIESVKLEDIQKILDLENQHNSWSYEDYEKDIASCHSFYYKVMQQDRMIAYIAFYDAFALCQLLHIKVDASYQHLGIGTMLIQHMEKKVKNHCSTITLEVNVSNETAIQFYTKLGYIMASTRKRYYPDGSDAYLYMKELRANGYNYIGD